MRQYKLPFPFIAFFVTLTALFIGCQDTDYPDPQPASGPSTLSSRFRFVNAAPGAPALNFLVENASLAQNVAYGQSSAYAAGPIGTVQVRGQAANGSIGGTLGSNDILFRAGATNQTNFSAAANANYTVFVTDTLTRAAGTASGSTDPGGPRFLVVTDVLTAAPADSAGIRFFNLVPNGGNLSLVLVPATTGPTVTYAARGFRATTAGSGTSAVNFSSFTRVPARTFRAEVRSGTTVLASTNLTAASGRLYTIYAYGLRGGSGANAPMVGVIQNN
ncbi:DUF4397 domain-containing protein [Tellurirhabdus rosea]|uniref:DUF4397 domain-containing protein n=1 Tax=Tellurirhabdus rosea TaxID=2674997 RepID=UPI002257F954|nr:DUF4397 domain-containing protein [Tellurirhabdus rosea]